MGVTPHKRAKTMRKKVEYYEHSDESDEDWVEDKDDNLT